MNNLRAFLSSSLSSIRQPLRLKPFEETRSIARPRILTDVSVIIRNDAQTGIQRVVRAVWTNLLEQSGTNFDVVPVYAGRTHGYRYARPDFLSQPVTERLLGKPVKVAAGDRFLGLDLSAHLLPSYERQLKMWRAEGLTAHLIVYDLLPLQRPAWFTEKTVRRFNRWLEVVRDNCDQALCISDQVAHDLRGYLSVAAARPAVGRLPLAGDIESSCPSRGIDAATARAIEYAKRSPAVLMVGTIEPRKGYDVALAAFEHLWQELGDQAPALIIIGKPGWRTDSLQRSLRTHAQSGRRLFWLSTVSDEGLARLYEASRGVLLASHAEGFGLPAVEAAMHSKHALVRDLPVFREQQLPNLLHFTDDSPAALGEMIIDLVRRSDAAPVPYDLPRWSDCVSEMLKQMGFGPAVPFLPEVPKACASA